MTLFKKEKCKLMKVKTAFKMQHILSDRLHLSIVRYDLQDFLEDFELTFPFACACHLHCLYSAQTQFFSVKISLMYPCTMFKKARCVVFPNMMAHTEV